VVNVGPPCASMRCLMRFAILERHRPMGVAGHCSDRGGEGPRLSHLLGLTGGRERVACRVAAISKRGGALVALCRRGCQVMSSWPCPAGGVASLS